MLDMVLLPKLLGMSIIIDYVINKVANSYIEVKKQLEASASKNKMAVNKYTKFKVFNEGDLVMGSFVQGTILD